MKKGTWKKLSVVAGVAAAAVLILLIVWSTVAGPSTVWRIIRYGDTDIGDFSHYPGRDLSRGGFPFSFDHAAKEMDLPRGALDGYGMGQDLDRFLESSKTVAFLVVSGDTILYERYFHGHAPSSLSQLFSVTKSFTSALVGLAIEDGYFSGVHQPITDHIPELVGRGFSGVTIHHLLTMMSGSRSGQVRPALPQWRGLGGEPRPLCGVDRAFDRPGPCARIPMAREL